MAKFLSEFGGESPPRNGGGEEPVAARPPVGISVGYF